MLVEDAYLEAIRIDNIFYQKLPLIIHADNIHICESY